METNLKSAEHNVRLAEVVREPWGDDGLPTAWVEVYPSSLLTAAAPQRQRASVRVRALPGGEVAVLAKDPVYNAGGPAVIQRYSERGELRAALRVGPPASAQGESWSIRDFRADPAGNVYLLETVGGGAGLLNSLRKLDASGAVVWERAGEFDDDRLDLAQLRGSFDQLLADAGGNVYLPATRHRGEVARIDPAGGEPEPYADWGDWTGEVFMDGEGRLHYVRYDPGTRRRGWARYDPRTRREELHEGDESVYGLFDIPFGTDARGRCYAAMGTRLTCLSREAVPLWQERLDNLVVAGGAIYASEGRQSSSGPEVVVRRWDSDGAYTGETILRVPSPPAGEGLANWRLVALDDSGRFHVRGGAAVEESALVYSPGGELESTAEASADSAEAESRLQENRTWDVDLAGGVLLPVLGPSAFHLVRLTVEAQPNGDAEGAEV